ncbi:MFS transporter [Pseudoroseomonas wenyumeiae]
MSQAKSATAAGLSPANSYQHERGNVLRLAVAQALAGANSVVVYATGAIVGHTLAPSPALATLPISIFVVGMAACTLPAGLIAQRHGRRAAFLTGTGCGVLVGLLAALAVVLGSFWLFCVATFFGGVYAAVVLPSASRPPIARRRSGVRGHCRPSWRAVSLPGSLDRSLSPSRCTCGCPTSSPPPIWRRPPWPRFPPSSCSASGCPGRRRRRQRAAGRSASSRASRASSPP